LLPHLGQLRLQTLDLGLVALAQLPVLGESHRGVEAGLRQRLCQRL